MIMPRGEPLLLPVNPVFIGASLAIGLAFNMLPLGRIAWMPDLLMVLLVFWAVHQPLRIGMGVAFVLGLCMEHAYRQQRGLPQFFHALQKVYAEGHFPCGWEGGKYPRGKLLIW